MFTGISRASCGYKHSLPDIFADFGTVPAGERMATRLIDEANIDPSMPSGIRKRLFGYAELSRTAPEMARELSSNLPAELQDGFSPFERRVLAYSRQSSGNLHNFILSPELAASLDQESLEATWRALQEQELLRLPYPVCWVRFRPDDFGITNGFAASISFVVYDDLSTLDGLACARFGRFIHVRRDDGGAFAIDVRTGHKMVEVAADFPKEDQPSLPNERLGEVGSWCAYAVVALVATLATRNVVKRTSFNTRAGTAKRSRFQFEAPSGSIYLSSTVLDVPASHELGADPDHPTKTGTSPRPHLRRGHAQSFAVGVGRTERRKRWVAPVFVNADPDFVATVRNNYVVR